MCLNLDSKIKENGDLSTESLEYQGKILYSSVFYSVYKMADHNYMVTLFSNSVKHMVSKQYPTAERMQKSVATCVCVCSIPCDLPLTR